MEDLLNDARTAPPGGRTTTPLYFNGSLDNLLEEQLFDTLTHDPRVDLLGHLFVQTGGVDPVVERACHRVTLVRPLLVDASPALDLRPFRSEFKLARLERYAVGADEQMPRVTKLWSCGDAAVDGLGLDASIEACRLRLADVGGGIQLALTTLDILGDYRDAIAALNAGYQNSLVLDGDTIETSLSKAFLHGQPCTLGGQRHQLAFWAGTLPDQDIVQRLLYRADLPAETEFCSFVRPPELNRRPDSAAYLGAYVSVMCRQQDYVENAALLSAMRIVGALARIGVIKQEAWSALDQLRSSRSYALELSARRAESGKLATRLRDLHIELAFEVEDSSTLADVIPSLRVEAFHRALWEAVELDEQTRIVSRVLERLTAAVTAEQQAIEAVEAREEDWRRLSWSVPLAIASAVAIPANLVLAFFGVGTRDVRSGSSMFDLSAYGRLYLLVMLVIVVAALTGVLIRRHGHRLVERDQEPAS